MKKVIGILGEKFSGKDETANYLVKKYGAFHVRFSHPLDEILNSLSLPVSRRNEIDLGRGLRQVFGEHVLLNAIVERVKKSGSELVVVNGIRYDEFAPIKDLGALMVYVTAPAELRFTRFQTRQEKADDASMDFGQFLEQEKEWTERDIPSLGQQADFKLENTGSLDELYKKIDEIISRIK